MLVSSGASAAPASSARRAPAEYHVTVPPAPSVVGHSGPSVGALLGFGTNDLNFGLGVRGGYTLPQHVYFGATLVYYTGGSDSRTNMTMTTELRHHVIYLGAEVGYDFEPGRSVTLRPYVGLGPGFVSESYTNCTAGVCIEGGGTDSALSGWFGGTALYWLNDFFIGGDVRVLFIYHYTSVGLFATAGLRF